MSPASRQGIVIVALTEPGKALGQQLQNQLLGAELWYRPKPFSDRVQQAFSEGRRLIFICATGIVIRTLAPVLTDKKQDPPVLVMDEQGRHVIALLSGHEGGANDWAAELASRIGAEPVITSARRYQQPGYTVGMGCERNCPLEALESLLFDCLALAGLELSQIDSLHSIDIKADEVGLIRLADKLGLSYLTWDKAALSQVEDQLSTRSEYVFKTVGVYGVAESAALVGAQQLRTDPSEPVELVLNKQKNPQATCAIARAYRG
ncbi:cobalamin biosynthesis protein [Motiliproteus sp.]|uniref:cobalamin biosynthesis protein n=1 Tax=Motiliproteus sp. TaxID=1898955 RepID=UPI003BAB18C7